MSDKSEAPSATGPFKWPVPSDKTTDLQKDMDKVKAIAGKTLGTMGESAGKKP
jgi:hypothetical protein